MIQQKKYSGQKSSVDDISSNQNQYMSQRGWWDRIRPAVPITEFWCQSVEMWSNQPEFCVGMTTDNECYRNVRSLVFAMTQSDEPQCILYVCCITVCIGHMTMYIIICITNLI